MPPEASWTTLVLKRFKTEIYISDGELMLKKLFFWTFPIAVVSQTTQRFGR